MVGDLISMGGVIRVVTGIHDKETENGVDLITTMIPGHTFPDSNLSFRASYCYPIQITSEILEKNFREYLPGINLMYQLKGPYFAMNEEGNQWVFGLVKEDGEKSCRYPLVKITYVHELQHALRLCGIKKEIVI